ncbi:oxygen-independent coproporphyrinogen III oxidase [Lewinella sp. W8]|uniref:oxygen-independent coproporphyrinogen III oxidase n=1 Tax=Lewinella sp. W8 TaxID=2528208 RepID=UPI001067A392|nr:oxygen-independent coproporphyrinogen III oxidase [Lewinella sp. W8]MTB51829.1 oxygen-independent coproporphyrinogen III oxidase [Lewinella sp. W8]
MLVPPTTNGYLIEKYDRPVPRYTSYPTVPYWQKTPPTQGEWLAAVNQRMEESQDISLYIHLPFCEKLCTYCGCNKRITINHGVEAPYVNAVLAEWKLYVEAMNHRPRIKELHLGGGTPTFFSPEELGRLIDGIFVHADRADKFDYSFEAHPSSTSREHLQALADRGFDRLSIGVQDFNQAILQLINRDQTHQQVLDTADYARATGYKSVNFDIIYGLPTQTREDIINTVQRIDELRPERIAFYSYAHVPWVSPGQRAYDETDLPRGLEKRALYELGKEMLTDIGYQDIGLDHFALPEDDLYQASEAGELHRNFMGYTALPTKMTIALGCSSIGDSWDMYVQNEKKVEDYQKAVFVEKRLPIIKGHQLTEEDQVVRQHILNLMCQHATEWRAEHLRASALERAVPLWNDMAADGLLRRSPYRIEVREEGMPFLRNICLPLDDYFWNRRPEAPTFSQSV